MPGAPGELVDSATAYAYCRALAASSPRVRVFTIGRSEEGRDIVLLAIADEAGIQAARAAQGRHRGAGRSAQAPTPRAGRAAGGQRAPDLLLQRRAAFGRDRLDRVGARAGLPAGGLRAADDPPHPREPGGADQPGLQPGRPRQAGRVVLPLPQGQDRSRQAAAPGAAVLVEVRLRGHQPRRAPAGARDHQGRVPHVLRLAPAGGPRPARERGAAGDLERHRPHQRARRSADLRRAPGAELPRGADADRARHAGRVDLELRR